jgi:hypothetical protein
MWNPRLSKAPLLMAAVEDNQSAWWLFHLKTLLHKKLPEFCIKKGTMALATLGEHRNSQHTFL